MNRRTAGKPVDYMENEELGELEVVKDDFLPSAAELAARAKRNTKVKITITLESASIDYFKQVAQEQNISYQKMIRMLLDEYVQQQKQQERGLTAR